MGNSFSRAKNKVKSLFNDGFFHILTGNTLAKLVSFTSTIAIIRIVSKSDYGNLVYADNLYSYAAVLSGLGMSYAILISCIKEENKYKKTLFFNMAIKYGVIIQIAASICIILYYLFIATGFRDAIDIVIALAAYPVGTYIVACILAYVRSAFQNKLFAKISLMQTVVVFVGSIIMAWCFGTIGIALARYVSIVVVIFFGIKFLKENKAEVGEKIHLTRLEKKEFLITSVSLLIMNMFSQLMVSNETFLVNYLINDEISTANYKTAILIPSQLIFVTSSIAVYFFPKVVKMGAGEEAWNYSKKLVLYTSIFILGIIILAIPITPLVIKIVFGTKYIDAIPLLKLFWVTYGINASIRMIPVNILPAIGKEKFNAVMSVISCAVHFVIDYYCISNYGIYGAAIASIIVYTISGAVAWIYLRMVCKRAERNEDVIK